MPVLPQKKWEAPNFIHGAFVWGQGPEIPVVSPWFGEVIGSSRESSAQDLDNAVRASTAAFPAWSRMPIKERSQFFFRFREILLRDCGKISEVISLENGKLATEAKAGILKGVEVLEFALSLQNLDEGAKMEVSRGVFCEYRREALGVVASITPFNFPAMVPLWTIPIALTLGNCLIWKPSEKTPLTSRLIAEALAEAGVPPGVFTVMQGGRTVVEAILDHPQIMAISFVGSTKVAKLVYERASKSGKRVLALGGAKNHIFLLPDADVELAGRGIADSFTGCAGQRCMAASVLLPIGDADKQLEKMVEYARGLRLGEDMGAIISAQQVDFLQDAIDRAQKAGAKILLDGRKVAPPKGYEQGNWIGPTVLEVEPGSEAATVELFGPVMSVIRCKNLREALAIENANPYGNAAAVFTNSGNVAEAVAREARAGMVGINVGVPVPREPFSFGGIQESKFGYGDITGPSSLDFWTNRKKLTTKWQAQSDASWMS